MSQKCSCSCVKDWWYKWLAFSLVHQPLNDQCKDNQLMTCRSNGRSCRVKVNRFRVEITYVKMGKAPLKGHWTIVWNFGIKISIFLKKKIGDDAEVVKCPLKVSPLPLLGNFNRVAFGHVLKRCIEINIWFYSLCCSVSDKIKHVTLKTLPMTIPGSICWLKKTENRQVDDVFLLILWLFT